MAVALDKLETQAIKAGKKWREKTRRADVGESEEAETAAPAEMPKDGSRAKSRVFRVNHHEDRKPMTLEEAMLEMGDGRDYLVYRDADKDCLSVLVRRPDGNFDLIES